MPTTAETSLRTNLVAGKRKSMVKAKKRTKVLSFAPRHDRVFENSKYMRLYSELRSNDVLFGESIGSSHLQQIDLAGNGRYLTILRKYKEVFVNTTGFDKRWIATKIAEETQNADPPARFMAKKLGTQWLAMNKDDVERAILKDLRSLYGAIPFKHKPVMIIQPRQLPTQPSKKGRTSAAGNSVVSSTLESFFQLPEMADERARLSDYNRLLLESLELFETTPADVATVAHRTVVGQLGVRCRYCAAVNQKHRQSQSIIGRIDTADFGISAIGNVHYAGNDHTCPNIPENIRLQLMAAKPLSPFQTRRRGDQRKGLMSLRLYFARMASLCGIVGSSSKGLKLAGRPEPAPTTCSTRDSAGLAFAHPVPSTVLLADVSNTITVGKTTQSPALKILSKGNQASTANAQVSVQGKVFTDI